MAKTKTDYDTKHIVISKENYDDLLKRGKAGDSMNDIISRLMGKEV